MFAREDRWRIWRTAIFVKRLQDVDQKRPTRVQSLKNSKKRETYRDTSSWETALGVPVPCRARDDAWRDSCEYGRVAVLFSIAETEPFCLPIKQKIRDIVCYCTCVKNHQQILPMFSISDVISVYVKDIKSIR